MFFSELEEKTMLIRVDPEILKQSSGNILGIGTNIKETGQCVLNVSRLAQSYDGQFGPKVQAIGMEAFTRSQGLTSQMNDHSTKLQSRAQAFEAADIAGVAGVGAAVAGFTGGSAVWMGGPLLSNKLPINISDYSKLGYLTNYSDQSGLIKSGYILKGGDWVKLGNLAVWPVKNPGLVSWKGIGRLMNIGVGNLKGGWVGKMDRLGDILQKPASKIGVPILGYGLGIAGDRFKGDNWGRALGSEAIETGADFGLPILIGGAVGGLIGGAAGFLAGGVGAIPGAVAGAQFGATAATTIYAAYQGILAVGYVFSAVEQLNGNEQQALELQNNLDKLDFGENIGNSIYDAAETLANR
jgi:hypothetical protein